MRLDLSQRILDHLGRPIKQSGEQDAEEVTLGPIVLSSLMNSDAKGLKDQLADYEILEIVGDGKQPIDLSAKQIARVEDLVSKLADRGAVNVLIVGAVSRMLNRGGDQDSAS